MPFTEIRQSLSTVLPSKAVNSGPGNEYTYLEVNSGQ